MFEFFAPKVPEFIADFFDSEAKVFAFHIFRFIKLSFLCSLVEVLQGNGHSMFDVVFLEFSHNIITSFPHF